MNVCSSGDLGDIVYDLNCWTAGNVQNVCLYPSTKCRVWLDEDRAENIIPLLRAGTALKSIIWRSSPIAGWNPQFDDWRGGKHKGGRTLIDQYSHATGLPKLPVGKPWLEGIIARQESEVLFNLTPRYRSRVFPFRKWLKHFDGRCAFVGLPEEHEQFCKEVGPIKYLPTANLLELAEIIAGSKLLICNPSCPLAIAHALCMPVLVDLAHRSVHIVRVGARYGDCPVFDLDKNYLNCVEARAKFLN